LWRRALRLDPHFRARDCPPCTRADVPAPGALRAGHADRGAAACLARPICLLAGTGEVAVNIEQKLIAMRDLIQEDVGNRGLRRDPEANLINACPDDFVNACRSVAETPRPVIKIITGFVIPDADPPCLETDGPL